METLPKADHAVVISAEQLLGTNITQPWSISHHRFWQERGKYHDGFFSAMEESSQWLWAFQQGHYENGLQFLKQIGRGGVIPNRQLSQRYLSDALGWLGTNSVEMPQMRSFVESAIRDLRRDGLLAAETVSSPIGQGVSRREFIAGSLAGLTLLWLNPSVFASSQSQILSEQEEIDAFLTIMEDKAGLNLSEQKPPEN